MIRLFVALQIPDASGDSLRGLCAGVPGARWVNPEQFHITLRFIGEVDGRTARAAMEELGQITMPSFPVELHGVGTFGDKRKAHSLWAGVRPSGMLTRLHDKIDGAMARIGLPPDRRKFTPHVTLARLNNAPSERLCAYLAHHGLATPPSFTCEGFTLFSSFLSSNGAIYTPERIYRLDGSQDFSWMDQEAENWQEEGWEDGADWEKEAENYFGAERSLPAYGNAGGGPAE